MYSLVLLCYQLTVSGSSLSYLHSSLLLLLERVLTLSLARSSCSAPPSRRACIWGSSGASFSLSMSSSSNSAYTVVSSAFSISYYKDQSLYPSANMAVRLEEAWEHRLLLVRTRVLDLLYLAGLLLSQHATFFVSNSG